MTHFYKSNRKITTGMDFQKIIFMFFFFSKKFYQNGTYLNINNSHFTTTEETTTSTTVDTTTAAATTSRASTTKSTTSTTSEPSENPSEPSDNQENQFSDDAEKDAQSRARPRASSPKPKKEGIDDIEHPDYPGSPRLNQGLAECPKYPDTLIGRQIPDSNLETEWEHVEETVADGLLEGGCWEPEDCFSTTKTAIIVPYKDRETHLKRLLYYLHPFLRRQKISYCIIVAEQYHDGRFNKVNILHRLCFANPWL